MMQMTIENYNQVYVSEERCYWAHAPNQLSFMFFPVGISAPMAYRYYSKTFAAT